MIYVYELQLLTGQIKVQLIFEDYDEIGDIELQLPTGQIKVQQ